MTLQQWANGIGMRGLKLNQSTGQSRFVLDSQEIAHSRTWLWDLEDYRVTSVSSGVIWLMPKTPLEQCAHCKGKTSADCRVHGIAAANARQNAFLRDYDKRYPNG